MRRHIIVLLSLLFLLFSLLPTWYELANRDRLKPIRSFELIHNFPTDYNFYLSRIRQGIEGRITVVEKYTSEPHTGSLIQLFYLVLGWVGRFNYVPPNQAGLVYHAARVLFGFVLLLLIGWATRRSFVLPMWQILAYLLAVTASSWPVVTSQNGQIEIYGYMRWWSVVDNLIRIAFVPHLLVGQALIIVLLYATADPAIMSKRKNWVFLGFLTVALGLIFPPGLVFFYGALAFLSVLEYFISTKKYTIQTIKEFIVQSIVGRLVVAVSGIPTLLYINYMTLFYPWKRLVEFDILHPTAYSFMEYMKAVGPAFPLGIAGLFVALLRREKRLLPVIAWVLAWQTLLEIFRHTPQTSPLRLTQMLPNVPLGILAAYFFYRLWKAALQLKKETRILVQSLSVLVPLAVIGTGLLMMAESFIAQRDFIDHKMRADYPLVPTGSYVMYPMREFVSAMRFLETSAPHDAVVLSDTTAGNYIPVYTGNTVYVGHDNTVRLEQKTMTVRAFFSGQMMPEEARTWLTNERITYVFFGPQEMEDGGVRELGPVYPFLTEVFRTEWFRIYRM